jgi:hypothetical protein
LPGGARPDQAARSATSTVGASRMRMSRNIGLGNAKNMPSRIGTPRNQIFGDRIATTRPPSKGVTGTRLKRLMKKPALASASSSGLCCCSASTSTATAPSVPTKGPPKAMRASCSTDIGCSFSSIQAPTKGMKVGRPTLSPERRATM